jgi:hypothetical protein
MGLKFYSRVELALCLSGLIEQLIEPLMGTMFSIEAD